MTLRCRPIAVTRQQIFSAVSKAAPPSPFAVLH